MQTKTALAVAGSVLAVPSTALAATTQDSETPGREALRASGRLTHDEGNKNRLVRTNLRLARREARLSEDRLPKSYTRRVRDDSVSVIRLRNQRLRRAITRIERRGSTASAPLQAIAACESGGDPTAIGGGGLYRGKYQFSMSTWASVGGTGDPATASETEQDKRASMLYERTGASSWPVCGR